MTHEILLKAELDAGGRINQIVIPSFPSTRIVGRIWPLSMDFSLSIREYFKVINVSVLAIVNASRMFRTHCSIVFAIDVSAASDKIIQFYSLRIQGASFS